MSLRILVVDDEPKFAQLMKALATPLGHIVISSGDYQEARERSQVQAFDVAFVGMRLPELRGLELLHEIRNSERNSGAIVVMLSIADDVTNLRRAFGEGADLVLTKAVPGDRLRRILAAMDSPEWRQKRAAARMPLVTEVLCTWNGRQRSLQSLNISVSGMLLQPALDAEIGQEVSLQFEITEVRAGLNLHARIIRMEGTERVGMEFIGLTPEDLNAIHVYVTGRLKDLERPRILSQVGPHMRFL